MPEFKKYFTVYEANSLIPFLKESFDRLYGILSEIQKKHGTVLKTLPEKVSINGGWESSGEYLSESGEINRILGEIMEKGAVVKDLQQGLVDFPFILEKKEVFLCWKLGEEKIRFYHDLNSGFSGRKPLPNLSD